MRCLPVEVSPHNPAYQQSVHEAWKVFIDGGEIRGRVPDRILDGWLLSRAARIDPMRIPDVPVLERQHLDDLRDEFATLLTAAAPVLDMLNSCIQNTGYMAILAAPSGHIIATVGDKDLLDMARTHYNMPGADRSINKVGASAIGMALQCCRPVQIFGYEHYNADLHSWRCASAPILADASGVLAVLTISGNIASPEIQALAMVTTFANYIGMRVRQQKIEATGQKVEALLRNAHDMLNYPLLVLDDSGGITHANRHASKLFTSSGPGLSGRSATSLVSSSDVQRLQLALSGQRLEHDSLTFLTDHGPQRIACTFSPVELNEGNLVGMTLSLNPGSSIAGGKTRSRADGSHSTATAKEPHATREVASVHTARYQFTDILGTSHTLRQAIDFARRASRLASRIIIYGESGTGKELFAQAIHNAGSDPERPFVGISCAAIPSDLIEAELFGYEEGAFTGARKGGQKGRLEAANGGTLFLDEVNSLPVSIQAKLLRVLQEMVFSPLGSNRIVRLDARVIAAGNASLADEVQAGTFRSDLYYRLNVVEIELPPLRERKGDVELLAKMFWRNLWKELGLPMATIEPAVVEALKAYPWPGNVRELQNVCERACILADGKSIRLNCLPRHILERHEVALVDAKPHAPIGQTSMDDLCESLVRETLEASDGNISKTSKTLGIARTTLYRKMKKYGLGQ